MARALSSLLAVGAGTAPDGGSGPVGAGRAARRRMGITVLVLLVLAGSAAAFAVSERLKVQKAAITGTQVGKAFSPVCGCATARATIAFRLTRPEKISVGIVDSDGRLVRTLVRRRLFGRARHHFTWNGRDDDGVIVPEGSYRPRIRIAGSGRTLVLPNPIRVDVTPPRIRPLAVRPPSFSPDGDGRADVVRVSYRISEHAHALLYVNGKQRVRTRFQPTRGELVWYGKVAGRTLPPGRYRLGLAAVDRAGNGSEPVQVGAVELRYVRLATRSLAARPGQRLVIHVSADTKRVTWTLARGSSVVARGSAARSLALRAPARPGRYTLVVRSGRHQARSALVVRRR